MNLLIGPTVGEVYFTGFFFEVCETVEDVSEVLDWDLVGFVVPSVDTVRSASVSLDNRLEEERRSVPPVCKVPDTGSKRRGSANRTRIAKDATREWLTLLCHSASVYSHSS